MKVQKSDDIRTPRQLILIGKITKLSNNKRAMVVKYKSKLDIMTLDEIASAIYQRRAKCYVEFID